MWTYFKWTLILFCLFLVTQNQVEHISANQAAKTVEITYPLPNDSVADRVQIMGSAFVNPNGAFFYFHLEYTDNPNADRWIRLRRSTSAVVNDRLAVWDTRSLYNGQYYLRLKVVDDSYNYAITNVIPVTVDNGPDAPFLPEPVEITEPVESETVRRVVRIRGSASTEFLDRPRFREKYAEVVSRGVSGTTFQYYKVEYSSAPSFADWKLIDEIKTRELLTGSLVNWDTTSIPNGTYALRLQLVFEDGNFIEDQTKVIVDNPPAPTRTLAQISRPEANDAPFRDTSIVGTATIDTGSSTFNRYILDYGAGDEPTAWFVIREGIYPEIEATLGRWLVNDLPNGRYTIRLRVQNDQGVVEAQDQIRLTLSKPTETVAEISQPEAGSNLVKDTSIRGTATVDTRVYELGRSILEYGVGEEPEEWILIREIPVPLQEQGMSTFEVGSLDNGVYSLRIQVEDVAGEVQASDQISVTVSKPTETVAEISQPEGGSTVVRDTSIRGTATVDTRVYELGRSILEYGVGEEPEEWILIREIPASLQEQGIGTFEVGSLDNGVYSLRIQVEDVAGEVQASDQISVTVSKPTETVAEISQPEGGSTVVRDTSIRGTATVDTRVYELGRSILEYGVGEEPEEWILIREIPVPLQEQWMGPLEVAELTNGVYSLRIQVEDVAGEVQASDQISVTVSKPTETVAEISQPEAGRNLVKEASMQDISLRGMILWSYHLIRSLTK